LLSEAVIVFLKKFEHSKIKSEERDGKIPIYHVSRMIQTADVIECKQNKWWRL
jgi:hypothetical protein